MRTFKKQFLSLALALLMLAAFVPFGVIRAADEEGYSLPMPDNATLEVTEVTEDVSEVIFADGAEEIPSDADDPSTFIDLETEAEAATDFSEAEIEPASERSPDPPEGLENLTSASVTVRAAPSSVSVPKGSSAKITLTHSGYGGCVIYKHSVSSKSVFSITWGKWDSYYSYSFKVNGLQPGTAKLRMYLYSYPENAELGKADITVTVTDNGSPSLTIDPSSLKLRPGGSSKVNVSFKNCQDAARLQYEISNQAVVKCEWLRSASGGFQVNVLAVRPGSASITVYVRNSYGSTLAYSSASVTVEQNLSLSISPPSVTVQAGRSASATVTTQGSGSYRITCASSNSTAFGCSLSDGFSQGATVTKTLVVTGRNAGSGYVKVYLKTLGGETIQSATVPITVTSAQPTLTVSPTSVTAPARVKCTLTGANGDERLYYSVSDTSIIKCSWSKWENNVAYLNIEGKKSGSGTVNIYIDRNGSRKFVSSVSVRTSGADSKGIRDYSYPFANYSKPNITLKVCRYMFGDNQYAQQAYKWHLGDGGVCFGIATSSGLFSAQSPKVSSFSGKTSISNLYLANYNSDLQLYLYEFIEGMHLSQKAQSMSMYSANGAGNLKQMLQAVSQDPVVVCIVPKNSGNGHAILAYDRDGDDLKIYDPNTPLREKTLSVSGSSWSYLSSSGYRWSDSSHYIYFIPYSTYSQVWKNRGFLAPKGGISARNLLITSAENFSLYAYENGTFAQEPIVQYRNGAPETLNGGAQEIYRAGSMPGMEEEVVQPVMLYVPVGYYKMVNDGETLSQMDVSLSHENVAVRVTTDAGECYLRADDDMEGAQACSTLPGIEDGRNYTVTLYSMEDGLSKEITVRGEEKSHLQTTVSLDADNGDAVISSQAFGDSALSEAEAASANLGEIALSVTQATETPNLFVSWTEGGRVVKETAENGDTICRIKPDEGYITKNVLVSESLETDPASKGAITEYLFHQTDGTLHAEFARKAEDAWEVTLSGELTADGLPKVTVTRKDGAESLPALEEGADYMLSYEDLPGAQDALYVTATPESGFLGAVKLLGDFSAQSVYAFDAARTAYWKDDAGIQVRVASNRVGSAAIAVAVYAGNGQMIAMKLDALSGSENEKTLSLPIGARSDAFTVKAFLLKDLESMELLCYFAVLPL